MKKNKVKQEREGGGEGGREEGGRRILLKGCVPYHASFKRRNGVVLHYGQQQWLEEREQRILFLS